MLERPYYIVYKLVERKGVKYPFLVMCALFKNKGFYRMENLDQYLYDGSSVTGEYIGASSSYYLVKDQNFNLKDFLVTI